MTTNKSTNEIGRRLVKGPRLAVANQAADEKYTTGSQRTNDIRKKKHYTETRLNLLQLNICGLNKKKTELKKLLQDNNVQIALLQETLHKNAVLNITGYTHYACECTGCRGIITYIRNDITADVQHLPNNNPTDVQKSTVWFNNKKFNVYNVYSPPSTTCSIEDLQSTTYQNTIIAGDFNAHSPLWGYSDTNNSGKYIEDLNETTNFIIQQNPYSTPTLLHRSHNTLHRPDLTIVSSDLDPACEVKVLSDMGSDHRPILTSITKYKEKIQHDEKPRWNFKKANWKEYTMMTEQAFKNISPQNDQELNDMVGIFTSTVLEAASKHIPRGIQRNYKAFWNEEIEIAVNERREARKLYEESPNNENKIEYNRTSAKAKRTIIVAKKKKWMDTCSQIDLRKDGRKAWRLLNNLSGNNKKTNPRPMPDGETPQKKAEIFNKFFASINKSKNDKHRDAHVLKELKTREQAETSPTPLFSECFTMQELEEAIEKLKIRKSPGPDKIHNEMIIKLGHYGKTMLLNLINWSWKKGTLPKTWKNAHIVPILKKDKDPHTPGSYRPISLTSCMGKVAERMVNKRLYWWLESSGLLCEEQSGFRASSRTEDQLFTLCQKIQDGFQDAKTTTAVFIDLQQAYDRVWRKGLLLKLQRLGVNGNLYAWLKSFLSERTIQTKIEQHTSSKLTLEEGIPQGSALSCTLFLVFINDMTKEIKSEKALYADDLVMWHTHKYTKQSARYLNSDLERLSKYCQEWKISINIKKTVYTIFSMSPRATNQKLSIKIEDTLLTKDEHPKYLGVQLDSRLTLYQHINNTKMKATKRLTLIKRLASTEWGSEMNTLRSLYIGYVRSVLEYNISLQISCSKSNQAEIDRVQNNAVRFICGGLRSTPTSACEIQTNVEPLALRREKAVLETTERLRRMNETHPAKKLMDSWKPKNRIKHQSILHHATKLKEQCHLPNEAEPIQRVSIEKPPHMQLQLPEIRLELKNHHVNKKSDPVTLKLATEDTIISYPQNWIQIYTDGSAFKTTVNAGYGSWIVIPDGTSHEISQPCGSMCSNFEAETMGIKAAIEHINTLFQSNPTNITNIVLYTDSKAALQSIKENTCKDAIQATMKISQLLMTYPIRLVLQWIPGHCDVPGNDKADQLAKKGARQQQQNVPASYKTAKQTIRHSYKEIWANRWAAEKTGRVVFRYMTKPHLKDPIYSLNRKDQTAIFRLRTQHTPLNQHLNRINSKQTTTCPLCKHPQETTEHLLFDCTVLQDIRQRFLPPSPDISNTLYSPTRQLQMTASFYYMALGRRACAQRLLD